MNTWSTIRKLTATLTLLAAVIASAASPLKQGDAFPDLSQFQLEGEMPNLNGKVVLVDFFASWCGPCKESFPVMQELHQKYADKGLVILAINVDKKKADMEKFLQKHNTTFPIVRDGANKLVAASRISTMPSSFLLDKDGKVYSAHRGFKGEETRKAYMEEIEALLK